ncbi:MAG: M1 family aminopeptidase [Bacteroidota bacterium]
MRILYFLLLCVSIILSIQAQQKFSTGAALCADGKQHRSLPQLMSKVASPNSPKHSYDALHYAIDLDLYKNYSSPFDKSFNGSVTITLRADSAISAISLDAVRTSIGIDSVRLAGISFVQSANSTVVQLNKTYQKDDTLIVKVYYHHNNVTDNAFFVGSDGMIFTDAEPEGARRWFPCWDKPYDKATMELYAKTPSNVKLGSNGLLKGTVKSGDSLTWHWVSRDPVSTYLIVISSKVNYNLDIVYWKKLSNPSDSIPIYFYWNTGENQNALTAAKTNIIPMTTRFSQLFGEHPFEKNGFATLNNQFVWGGMENQTLTSLLPNGYTGEFLVAHEYAHQWFGDMITCATWADIWLNEGFATFSEALWAEKQYGGAPAYQQYMEQTASGYMNANPGWAIYVPEWAVNVPNSNTLFNTAITYNKGASVLYMLRAYLGDSVFFDALQSYGTNPLVKFGSVTTDDFIQIMNTRTKQNLSWFLDEWLKQANHPEYTVKYTLNSAAKSVFVRIQQTQAAASFWKMPVDLRFTLQNGTDTTVTVWNTTKNDTFSFSFASAPLLMACDPKNKIILKKLSVVKEYAGPLLAAVPGTLYAASGSTDGGKLYTVNTGNGTLTLVRKIDVAQVNALRVHPKSKELIVYNNAVGTGGAFYRMSSNGVDMQLLSNTTVTNLKGLAYYNDSSAYIGAFSGIIYSVNVYTGVLTQIGTNGSTQRPGGFAVNPVNGTLWMSLRNTSGAVDNIYKLNRTTGLSTLVGSAGIGSAITDIVFDKKGTLYGLAGTGTATNSLVRIDTTTGTATVIGSLGKADIQALGMDPDVAAGVEQEAIVVPSTVTLEQNYPNPFNPTTIIRYSLPKESNVQIAVYNILGQFVQELVNEEQSAGWKEVHWNAEKLSGGIYFVKLTSGKSVEVRKMMLLK